MLSETIIGSILSVLNEVENEVELELCIPNDVENYLKTMGYEKGEMDTNGWDYDYQIPYNRGDQSFTFAGSGYYGNQAFSNNKEIMSIDMDSIDRIFKFECPYPNCSKLITLERETVEDLEGITCPHCNEVFKIKE